MLTLNTNAWWNWGYALSNKEVSTIYPQIEDNILLFPELYQYNSNRPTAFSVNWTVVNAISWVFNTPYNLELVEPIRGYNGSSWFFYYPPVSFIRFWNNTFRISSPEPLSSWMTIWKTIIIPRLYWTFTNSSWTEYDLQVKVWLLHTDWTITYMAEKQQAVSQTIVSSWTSMAWLNIRSEWQYYYYNRNYWNSWRVFWETTKINTNWYITQEWDYIIVEYNTLWSTSNEYVSFWTQTPTRESEMIYPIQVSID